MHKKKRNQNEPLPFQLVKIFAKNYPRVWEYCDTFYKGKGKGLPRWNDLCVLPIAATLAIMGNYPIESIDEMSVFPAECAALYAWRRYKEIFTFDGDLAEMLLEQSDDIEVPLEVLYALPYPCIWITTCQEEKLQSTSQSYLAKNIL